MIHVTVYTTPTCPWCEKTKKFLQQKKILYAEKNVVEDESARNEMIRKSHQMGVPVLDINGKIIIGFEPKEILQAVTKASPKKKLITKNKLKKSKKTAKKQKKEKKWKFLQKKK